MTLNISDVPVWSEVLFNGMSTVTDLITRGGFDNISIRYSGSRAVSIMADGKPTPDYPRMVSGLGNSDHLIFCKKISIQGRDLFVEL